MKLTQRQLRQIIQETINVSQGSAGGHRKGAVNRELAAAKERQPLDPKAQQRLAGAMEDIAPDCCDFDDIPDFERDFWNLVTKYNDMRIQKGGRH